MRDLVAYCDESNWNDKRFRAIAMISAPCEVASSLESQIAENILEPIAKKGRTAELKWTKVKSADHEKAVIHVIDLIFDSLDRIRVDVLIWDIRDSRHSVQRRDDVANMQRMYFHLFKNVARERWPSARWTLYVDEHTQMDWDQLLSHLRNYEIEFGLGSSGNGLILNESFRLEEIISVESGRHSLVQVADLMAGLATFSCLKYEEFEKWSNGDRTGLSASERYRYKILDHLDRRCKERKLQVSLRSRKGLYTYDPKKPLNFWRYTPQHPLDKAPTK